MTISKKHLRYKGCTSRFP